MVVTKIIFVGALLCLFEIHGIYGQRYAILQNYTANNYNMSDSNQWYLNYPRCAGRTQSPVNIITNESNRTTNVPIFQYANYNRMPINMTLHNTGLGLQLIPTYNDGEEPHLSGGLLNGDYVFDRYDVLSGPDNQHGSLHPIDGHYFALEMHAIHYKRDYGNLGAAFQQPDGIVAGVLLIQTSSASNTAFTRLSDYVGRVTRPYATVNIEPFPVTDFGIDPSADYYQYNGSLAFPPCNEDVTFIIPTTRLNATAEQIQSYRAVQLVTGERFNTRPIQPFRDQRIFFVEQNRN